MIRRIKNDTLDEIKFLEKAIDRCKENIIRLKSTTNFNPRIPIEKNNKEIEELNKRLILEREKLQQIEDGTYVSVLNEEIESTKQEIKVKSEISKKKKLEKTQNNSFQRPTNKKSKTRTDYKQQPHFSNIKKEMDIATKYYFKDCASIPDYLLNKLENMPNNMGYIWKDIWCYGSKPCQHNFTEYVMFEKNYSKFYVHTFNPTTREYCLYEKDNANKRHLISSKFV